MTLAQVVPMNINMSKTAKTREFVCFCSQVLTDQTLSVVDTPLPPEQAQHTESYYHPPTKGKKKT